MTGLRLRLRRLATILAVVLAVQGGVSLALRTRPLHYALRARLEKALGRPVEVGRFGISVWSGLRLEAHYITVADDPQFGHEFLLRADELSASPDLRALLRGRLLFNRFSFDRPSLNMVRTPEGRWNFESWAAVPRSLGTTSATGVGRVDGIALANGRINFKRGADKLPFALVAVNGRLSPAADGRWRVALEAQPLRAGVTLQEAGTLRLAGTFPAAGLSGVVAGMAKEADPTQVSMEWRNASLSDALRLIAGSDFGVRGSFEAAFSVQSPHDTSPLSAGLPAPSEVPEGGGRNTQEESLPRWRISGTLRLADVHRWDLPLQAGLPGLNLFLSAYASADRREWQLPEIVLEARRSNLRGSAAFRLGEGRRASLRVVSASIHLDDLLAWYRAFHPGVRPGTWVDGYLGADVELQGWPPGIAHATLATTGARLNIPGESSSLELHRTVLEADSKGASLKEARLSAGSEEAGVRLTARANWTTGIPLEATLAGSTSHLASLSNAIAALGLSPTTEPLRAAGSVFVRLNWKGSARPWRLSTSGTLTLEDVTLAGGPLRSEILFGNARLDFLAGQRRLQLSGTKAFGAMWAGTLRAPMLAGPWEFALTADRLMPATLVRGFARETQGTASLLSRILPTQAASTLAREQPQWPGWLRGEGTVAIGTLAVGRLEFERLKSNVSIGEREIVLQHAEAGIHGGNVRGEVRADFGEQPRYAVRAAFDRVGVAALAGLAVSTRQCCTGTGSGQVNLTAAGWDRDALFASLAGAGHAEVRSGAILTLDLPATLHVAALRPGHTAVRLASADFLFSSSQVQLERLSLDVPPQSLSGLGSVSYRGELDVSLAGGVRRETGATSGVVPPGIRVTGTLAAPKITSPSTTP